MHACLQLLHPRGEKNMLLTLFLLFVRKFIYNVTLPEIHCIFIALPNLKSATEFPT